MSAHYNGNYHMTSTDAASKTVYSLQNQINSLAAVILQHGCALDVLTAEKGGYGAMLGE